MADKSKIEWCDASWTAIRARNKETGKIGWYCEHVTPGCERCYSETMNVGRFGTGLPFKPGHRKDVDIFLDEKMLQQPLHWKRPRKIFVCSMTDLFADFVPDKWIDQVFAIMALCPQHTFQVLTKRSKRMREYVRTGKAVAIAAEAFEITCQSIHVNPKSQVGSGVMMTGDIPHLKAWPLPNVWLGVSAEDQTRANERIPDLLLTPAAKRFVSAEPLLSAWWPESVPNPTDVDGLLNCLYLPTSNNTYPERIAAKLDWIIAGGESGRDFRPMQIAWAEDIMRQCKSAGTAFFFKQDSAFKSGQRGIASDELWTSKEFPA